jgi:hypothetical protein
VLFPEGFLHRVQLAIRSQALNGRDIASIRLYRQDCIGLDLDTIHQYGTRAVLTGVTAVFVPSTPVSRGKWASKRQVDFVHATPLTVIETMCYNNLLHLRFL